MEQPKPVPQIEKQQAVPPSQQAENSYRQRYADLDQSLKDSKLSPRDRLSVLANFRLRNSPQQQEINAQAQDAQNYRIARENSVRGRTQAFSGENRTPNRQLVKDGNGNLVWAEVNALGIPIESTMQPVGNIDTNRPQTDRRARQSMNIRRRVSAAVQAFRETPTNGRVTVDAATPFPPNRVDSTSVRSGEVSTDTAVSGPSQGGETSVNGQANIASENSVITTEPTANKTAENRPSTEMSAMVAQLTELTKQLHATQESFRELQQQLLERQRAQDSAIVNEVLTKLLELFNIKTNNAADFSGQINSGLLTELLGKKKGVDILKQMRNDENGGNDDDDPTAVGNQ